MSARRHIALLTVGMTLVLTSGAFAQQTFGGYDCTEDCSGHKAGYDWAQQNEISDPSDCSGNSQSFIEGCEAYTDNPYRGSSTDDDGNEIDN